MVTRDYRTPEGCFDTPLTLNAYSGVQNQKAASAYFTSKQMLPFGSTAHMLSYFYYHHKLQVGISDPHLSSRLVWHL